MYTAENGSWTVATAGNALPGTNDTWSGFSMTFSGQATTGTFDQTASTGSSDQVISGAPAGALWEAGFGQGQTSGALSVTVTSLGPATNLANATLYQAPHGSLAGTLVDQNPLTAMPSVSTTIAF